MKRPSMKRSTVLLAASLATVHGAHSQETDRSPPGPFSLTQHIPEYRLPDYRRPAGFLYVLGSANDDEYNFAKEVGFTIGGMLELSRHFGLAEEGSFAHWHGPLHTYLALAGPRISWPVGRFTPFAEMMGGIGHAGTAGPTHLLPASVTPSFYGIAASGTAGLDLRLTDRLSWRIVQASAARINTVPVYQPRTGGTGLLVRLFEPR